MSEWTPVRIWFYVTTATVLVGTGIWICLRAVITDRYAMVDFLLVLVVTVWIGWFFGVIIKNVNEEWQEYKKQK